MSIHSSSRAGGKERIFQCLSKRRRNGLRSTVLFGSFMGPSPFAFGEAGGSTAWHSFAFLIGNGRKPVLTAVPTVYQSSQDMRSARTRCNDIPSDRSSLCPGPRGRSRKSPLPFFYAASVALSSRKMVKLDVWNVKAVCVMRPAAWARQFKSQKMLTHARKKRG